MAAKNLRVLLTQEPQHGVPFESKCEKLSALAVVQPYSTFFLAGSRWDTRKEGTQGGSHWILQSGAQSCSFARWHLRLVYLKFHLSVWRIRTRPQTCLLGRSRLRKQINVVSRFALATVHFNVHKAHAWSSSLWFSICSQMCVYLTFEFNIPTGCPVLCRIGEIPTCHPGIRGRCAFEHG